VSVALKIGATIGALFGKYATLKVFASGGIDAPESEYFTVQPTNSIIAAKESINNFFIPLYQAL
jgi:hypothetical protein